jgi:hypothetical protein
MSLSNNFPAVRPTLLLDFAAARRLDPRITFVRASPATYYDGVTKALAEQNLFLYSQEFNQANWVQSGVTVSANSTIAPDGTVTADSIIPTAVSGQFKELQQNFLATSGLTYAFSVFLRDDGYSFVQLVGTSATFGTFAINYDLSTGVETQFSAGTSTVVSRSITAFGSGWYRVSVVITAIGTGSARLAFNVIPASTSARGVTWTGDGGSGVAAWGAQIEQRGTVTAYTATTTAFVSNYQPVLVTAPAGVARFDFNPVTDVSLGLLIEEARTNLILQSDNFATTWTPSQASVISNIIVSPDGTVNGDKLVEDATNNAHQITQNVTVATTTVYTMSCYMKAGERTTAMLRAAATGVLPASQAFIYNLSAGTAASWSGSSTGTITAVGNGWYRCTMTLPVTIGAGTLTYQIRTFSGSDVYTGDGYSGNYIWGAQLEAGTFPTTYIATVATTQQRNADVATMTGTNFTSWYGRNANTLYAEFSIPFDGNATRSSQSFGIWGVSNSALGVFNGYGVRGLYSSSLGDRVQMTARQGSTVLNATTSTSGFLTANTIFKTASVWDSSSILFCLQGVAGGAVTNTVYSQDTDINTLNIGNQTIGGSGPYQLNGTIRKIAYYDVRLTTAQLQTLTQS